MKRASAFQRDLGMRPTGRFQPSNVMQPRMSGLESGPALVERVVAQHLIISVFLFLCVCVCLCGYLFVFLSLPRRAWQPLVQRRWVVQQPSDSWLRC